MDPSLARTEFARAGSPAEVWGRWELALLGFMISIYLAGLWLNPVFFGSTDAVAAILRDSARFGVMAVGMSFVIVNRDIDLSVGSAQGLVAVVFSILFAPTAMDLGAWPAAALCLCLGIGIGIVNGVLVTSVQVPAFIATLATLFIGRGLILGLTGRRSRSAPCSTTSASWPAGSSADPATCATSRPRSRTSSKRRSPAFGARSSSSMSMAPR